MLLRELHAVPSRLLLGDRTLPPKVSLCVSCAPSSRPESDSSRPLPVSRSRKLHWNISLNLILVLLLFVIPLVQSFLITRYRSSSGEARLPFSPSLSHLELTTRPRFHSSDSSYHAISTNRTPGSKRKKILLRRLAVALVPFSLSTFLFTCVPVPSSMVLNDGSKCPPPLPHIST